jgi:hypothetical protein
MPAKDSPTTSSSSADEERHLLSPAPESSDSERHASDASEDQYDTELELVEQEATNQTTLKPSLPVMRTLLHATASALNPFNSPGSIDSRIIATALATLLTYGFLPLEQLREQSETLGLKIKKLREDLALLEHYPGADVNLITTLGEEIKALTKRGHKLGHAFLVVVGLMMVSSAISTVFSVLRVTSLVDDNKWVSGTIEGSHFSTALLILLSFVFSGATTFYEKNHSRLEHAEQLDARIKLHLKKAQERSRDFFQGLGERDVGAVAMLQYFQAKTEFDQVATQLGKKREVLETYTSNQALLRETARAAMLRRLGDVSARREELQTALTQIQDSLNMLNDRENWRFLGYAEILSELTAFLNTLPEKPEAVLQLIAECNAIELAELKQYNTLEQRDAFAKACLISTLESGQINVAAFLNTMAESLSQACPNINRIKALLNIVSQTRIASLIQDSEKQIGFSDIIKKLKKCCNDLSFSDQEIVRQSNNIMHLSHQYEENRQNYNRLLETSEQNFARKTPASDFFEMPHFERVEILTELMLPNQLLKLSEEQPVVLDRSFGFALRRA